MIVICNTIVTAPYVREIGTHVPTVWSLHEAETGLRRLLEHPEDVDAFNKAAAIVIPSATIRDRIYRPFLLEVPDGRVHIVPPGFEPPEPSDDPVSMAKEPGKLEVIGIGAVDDSCKRSGDLMRAAASLRVLSIECAFVGRRLGLEDDDAALAEQHPDRFRFVGELPHAEAMRLLARADILAHPSLSECLPLAPLEAGLRSKPVVLADLAAHAGIWRHGVNCLLHPRADANLLAHMLRILAADPPLRARLGDAARQTAAAFRYDLFTTRLGMVLASLA